MSDEPDNLVRDHRIMQLRAAGLPYPAIAAWPGVGISQTRVRQVIIRETRMLIDLLPRHMRDAAALAEDRALPSGVRRLKQLLGENARARNDIACVVD